MNKTATQIQTAVVGGGISKGNAYMKVMCFLIMVFGMVGLIGQLKTLIVEAGRH
jgi:hypothetical protein